MTTVLEESELLDHDDRDDLRQAYEEAGGAIEAAAERFVVGPDTLHERLIEYGILDPSRPRTTKPGEELSTGTTNVRSYLPEYQKREWKAHADHIGVSLSEFVRIMTQAGRRGLATWNGSGGSSPPVSERVLDVIDALDGPVAFDELAYAIDATDDRTADALEELQATNEVVHDGRKGGYVRAEDG